MVGSVITHKMATLHELDTVYSYDDMLDMIEIIQVNSINEYLAQEYARKTTERGKIWQL